MTEQKIKIAIADDHPVLTDSLGVVVDAQVDMELLFTANEYEQLFAKLKWDNKPDILLMDYSFGEIDGEECTRQLLDAYGSQVKVIGLSMHDDEGIVFRMISAGARGFVGKANGTDRILEVIREVQANGLQSGPEITGMLLNKLQRNQTTSGPSQNEGYAALSQQDIDIIKFICMEKSNEEIADEMHLSVNTINTYRKRILKKLNCKNTAGLVVYAMRNGIFN